MPPKYTYVKFLLVQFYFLLSAHLSWAAYSIPELTFEALTPTGLRVSIPGMNKLKVEKLYLV